MIIYHGSLEKVEMPCILPPTRTLDYGSGFYATTSMEQAEQWVKRKRGKTGVKGYVNAYELDESQLEKLQILRFEYPTDEWVDFVMANRMDASYIHHYDIVYGPVANDRVYAAFALYEANLLDKEGLIKELRAYKLVDQLLFHTQRSLQTLHFIEAKEV
ncbi:MAG: DUF3990 domain-containing protein [Bacteroides sp.]|nr:DUF3990 domain-containing protein [Bacteroides sp.]